MRLEQNGATGCFVTTAIFHTDVAVFHQICPTNAVPGCWVNSKIDAEARPSKFGGREAPTIAGGIGFERLADACQFKLKSKKQVKNEIFLVYRALVKSK